MSSNKLQETLQSVLERLYKVYPAQSKAEAAADVGAAIDAVRTLVEERLDNKENALGGTTFPTQRMYVVLQNTDCTEGRGVEVPIAVCINPVTAKRIGKGKGVHGADCKVKSVDMFEIGGAWYGPTFSIHYPTKEDVNENEKFKLQCKIYKKMLLAGIPKEEIVSLLRPEVIKYFELVEDQLDEIG